MLFTPDNEVYKVDFLSVWHRLSELRKPTIAAVSGYALGGGCEIALMCDIVLASPTAQFGQPEIDLGIIPGAGGTQRLTQAVGKSRAMELVLTGRRFNAQEAVAWGVASRVVGEGEGQVVKEAVELAKVIASKGALAVQAGKEAVKASLEVPLSEGLRYERRLFHGLFATQDQKEGTYYDCKICHLSDITRSRNVCLCGEEETKVLAPLVRKERKLFCVEYPITGNLENENHKFLTCIIENSISILSNSYSSWYGLVRDTRLLVHGWMGTVVIFWS